MKTPPLGVDIGATRIRVVSSAITREGPAVAAVATRDLSEGVGSSGRISDPGYIAALLEEIIEELGTKERRCVLGIGEPEAVLRIIQFPKMSSKERERAAEFEAQRYIDYPAELALVRLHPVDEQRNFYAMGIVRRETLRTRLQAVRGAGFKPVAIDNDGLAYRRALPAYDAVVDVGLEKTVAYVHSGTTFASGCKNIGGAEVTRSIERELSIDSIAAEKRKRILGTSGAGECGRSALLAEVTSLLEAATSRSGSIARVALCGNGARLNNFASDLERATGLSVEIPVSPALEASRYPRDVLKAGALDWNLATGLSLWDVRT